MLPAKIIVKKEEPKTRNQEKSGKVEEWKSGRVEE
jgi:hypothetical protein